MKDESSRNSVARINRDPAAFEAFYLAYFDRVVNFVARRGLSPADLADTVADVFVEAAQSSSSFDPSRGDPLPWLLGIASNRLSSAWRTQRRQRKLVVALSGRELLSEGDYTWLEDKIDAARTGATAEGMLSKLSASERAVVELVDLEGLSTVEASEALCIRPATARMRLTRARRKLRHMLNSGSGKSSEPGDRIPCDPIEER